MKKVCNRYGSRGKILSIISTPNFKALVRGLVEEQQVLQLAGCEWLELWMLYVTIRAGYPLRLVTEQPC